MYMIKYAFLNLWREKRKTLVLSLLFVGYFFLLINISLIYASFQVTVVNYQEELDQIVRISSDGRSNSQKEVLTEDDYLKYGHSDFIDGMDISAAMLVQLKNIMPENQPWATFEITTSEDMDATDIAANKTSISTAIFATMNQDIGKRLSKNSRKLVKGSSRLSLNECLVEQRFAESNNLSVGSKILLYPSEEDSDVQQELVVAGIWQEKSAETVSSENIFQQEEIITNYETLKELPDSENSYRTEVVYHLKRAADFKKIEKEVREKGLPKGYHLVSDKDSTTPFLSSVKYFRDLTLTSLLSVLIIGTVAVLFFSIRLTNKSVSERYTFMSFGMKKSRIIYYQCLEKVVLVVIGLFLAFLGTKLTMGFVNDALVEEVNQLLSNTNELIYTYDLSTTIAPLAFSKETLKIMLVSTSALLLIYFLGNVYQIFIYNPVKFLLERKSDR